MDRIKINTQTLKKIDGEELTTQQSTVGPPQMYFENTGHEILWIKNGTIQEAAIAIWNPPCPDNRTAIIEYIGLLPGHELFMGPFKPELFNWLLNGVGVISVDFNGLIAPLELRCIRLGSPVKAPESVMPSSTRIPVQIFKEIEGMETTYSFVSFTGSDANLKILNNGGIIILVNNKNGTQRIKVNIFSGNCSHGRTIVKTLDIEAFGEYAFGPYPVDSWNWENGEIFLTIETEEAHPVVEVKAIKIKPIK